MKIINKIKNIYYRYINRKIFTYVSCNIDFLSIGSEVAYNFDIKHPERLTIGNGTAISGDCLINALGKVSIGKYCHIAKGLTIYSHNHNYKSKKSIPYDNEVLLRSVKIGDAVWIGANVTIAPGTQIGDGVIISSGAVVFGKIPDCAIIRGNPATIIDYRNKDDFFRLYSQESFF